MEGAGYNANGITPTPDGRGLIVVQSNAGGPVRLDPSGATRRVDLHHESLPEGDGLLLHGRTLFAVQNLLNTAAVLRLNATGTDGRVVQRVRAIPGSTSRRPWPPSGPATPPQRPLHHTADPGHAVQRGRHPRL
ncbi:hypothetical protein ACH347_39380 [Saccharopolyspora sp. 5N102]|uniref:hypothetical protein n=1 Tax=Saccharopolyspora sp. 5N102 TaxID=3375155 RepID=UPI0037993101